MGRYRVGLTFSESYMLDRQKFESALDGKRLEFRESGRLDPCYWQKTSVPCPKDETDRILLELYDGLADDAKEFAHHVRTMEFLLDKYNISVETLIGSGEYAEAWKETEEKPKRPTIVLVK